MDTNPITPFKNVTLEMSLKPFRQVDETSIRQVAATLFRQWAPFIRYADQVSILFWQGDGTEIMIYTGDLNQEMEWARYIGGCQTEFYYYEPALYMENPPRITYGKLGEIVRLVRQVGTELTGKPVRMGTTFDPGPEFTKSPFKYETHREIVYGQGEGYSHVVSCFATLNDDTEHYAGFPEGIPEGLHMGTFLGRQSQRFMTDLGFDYLWLSNGFGFGTLTWNTTGCLFDGETFEPDKASEFREKTLSFWHKFREECPDLPIETRGSNQPAGVDIGTDAVDLRAIYHGNFKMLPPPNSPWAALNRDVGLEMAGYMSRLADVPDGEYPFRFYSHDPWWLNSPWIDRYGRQPYDIYLPMAVARINAEGETCLATHVDFLTIDDSYGRLPEDVPREIIPHILTARAHAPDAPGPLVWVHAFDEYHAMTFEQGRPEEAVFGDWFMKGMISHGVPVNTVVSSANLLASLKARPDLYDQSILIAQAPDGDTPLAASLADHVEAGGQVLLYGPLRRTSERLRKLLNLDLTAPMTGTCTFHMDPILDTIQAGAYVDTIEHRYLLSAGGLEEVLADADDPATQVTATYSQGTATRIGALCRTLPQGGKLAWVRGTNSCTCPGRTTFVDDDANDVAHGWLAARFLLACFDLSIRVGKRQVANRDPSFCVARRNHGLFFSGLNWNTTEELQLCLPGGAPLFLEREAWMQDGHAHYVLPRAWHHECRVLVEQDAPGTVSCVERPSLDVSRPLSEKLRRRFLLRGLQNATVRFLPEAPQRDGETVIMHRPPKDSENGIRNGEPVAYTSASTPLTGPALVAAGITGALVISW